MMLRLRNRSGGRSFEQTTGPLKWADDEWVKINGTWDTAGGECVLWSDGVDMKRGKFNAQFPGFRRVFLEGDNYQPNYLAVAGTTYRNFRLHSLEECREAAYLAAFVSAVPSPGGFGSREKASLSITRPGLR